jgi:hypothetical protein
MSATHVFQKSKAQGERWEAEQDAAFASVYGVTPADAKAQRFGVDRLFTHAAYGLAFTVEYKADDRATDTGNFFFEVVSVDTTEPPTPGWALTSKATLISILVPREHVAFLFITARVRECVPGWVAVCPVFAAKNPTYCSHGVCVPRAVALASPAFVTQVPVPELKGEKT